MQLEGKLLVAMPGMDDPRFTGSVILICAHSAEGAMGLIVNKPLPDLRMDALLRQLQIPQGAGGARDIVVHFGGPVERARGFVLHSPDYRSRDATMTIGRDYAMTATVDVLQALADGQGPQAAILALGYSGWGPGQLENEILANGWLVADPVPDVIFAADDGAKWAAVLRGMGIDPITLSSAAGRA